MNQTNENKTKSINNLIILYSGGSDSRLLLELATKMYYSPMCILIDYNQKHRMELIKAKQTLMNKKIKFESIKLQNFNVRSALTTKEKGLYGNNVSQYNVPNRNMILLSIAVSYAENLGINKVWYGADFSDRLGFFPDCYQEYVVKMNDILNDVTSFPIKIEAPLLGMSKEMVFNMLTSYNINDTEYFSGYGKLT